MKFDHTLLTGMFLGLTLALMFTASLSAYLPFFLLASLVFLMGYMHN